MNKYIGLKMIEAEYMDQKSFVEIVEGKEYDSTISALGYRIVSSDGKSEWKPKDEFEASYMRLS